MKCMYALAVICSISPVFLIMSLLLAGSWKADDPTFVTLHSAWVVSFVLLFLLAVSVAFLWKSSRMDAFWWLSVPFGLGGAALLFAGPEMRQQLTGMFNVYAVGLCVAFGWLVVALRQLSVNGRAALTTRRIVMMCGAGLAVAMPPILYMLGDYVNGGPV